jgi:hypothetical protein
MFSGSNLTYQVSFFQVSRFKKIAGVKSNHKGVKLEKIIICRGKGIIVGAENFFFYPNNYTFTPTNKYLVD